MLPLGSSKTLSAKWRLRRIAPPSGRSVASLSRLARFHIPPTYTSLVHQSVFGYMMSSSPVCVIFYLRAFTIKYINLYHIFLQELIIYNKFYQNISISLSYVQIFGN